MFASRPFLLGIIALTLLVAGIWLGSRLNTSPRLIPTANAQGLVVNQDLPDQLNAAAFSINQEGDVLYWWRVQSNGLGTVTIFDSRTGSVRTREFRR
jgi:hypothetical protein